jgi:peptidoglycan hydrolase-like protein with peptidoglycan-binding domain
MEEISPVENAVQPAPQRRRLPRSQLLALIGTLAIGLFLGGLIVSLLNGSPDTSPIDNAQADIRVTTVIESRPVRAPYSLSGTVSLPQLADVALNGEGAISIVTGGVHGVGEVINSCDLVAEISGQPVFAFPFAVPLYRDLGYGDTGNDVRGLQQALVDAGLLSIEPDGWFGWSTIYAVQDMYSRAGYKAPDVGASRGVLFSHTATVPSSGLAVAEASPVGTAIDATHPVMKVISAPAAITARADMLQAAGFKVGTSVLVQIGSAAPIESQVLSVSEFKSEGSNQAPGYDVVIALPADAPVNDYGYDPVIVNEIATVPQGLGVPLTAIRQDANGTYVYKVAADSNSLDTRIAVKVAGQSSGFAIIAETEELSLGDEIVLSGERP